MIKLVRKWGRVLAPATFLAVPLPVTVAVVAALAAANASPAVASSPATLATSTPSLSAPCPWYGETDQRDGNIGAPDLDAYYVLNPLHVSADERVVIHGDFPLARYFSFHVYDASGQPLGSLYDQQITADRGSENPFRHRVRAGAGDSYSVTIRFLARPRRPAPNTLYVDPAKVSGIAPLVYRLYVPTRPTDYSGGVPYPTVELQSADGATTLVDEPGCATVPPPFGSALYEQFAAADYPSFLPTPAVDGATAQPTWARSFGSALGNQQNAYLGAIISRQYGQLVVIHGYVPTFPNTRRGVPVYRRTQVRYWSFCTYDSQGQAGYGCAADYATQVRRGTITLVVSDPGSRPPNATAQNGVTWLPWGGNQYSAQIVERNMLPGARFAHAIQRITQTGRSADSKRVMGAYYPQAVYCSPQRFAAGGWRACFRAAGVAPAQELNLRV